MDKRKILLASLFILALISLPSFVQHARWFITGHVEAMVIQNRWDLALLNIGLFLLFLIPLNFRKKVDWRSMSIYVAFIVSLFIEMYGIPLTIYLTSTVAFSGTGAPPDQTILLTMTFLGQTMVMTFWKMVGAAVSIIGMSMVIVGWVTLYRNREKNDLVASGLYRYSRHPQYFGIILISLGWFIHWPSLLTMAMLPVLIYFYYKLTQEEEKEVMEELEDPELYEKYRKNTPRFL
ncbi:MAG: methyltransferase family protein [Candidatus Natronoplasma sp.]